MRKVVFGLVALLGFALTNVVLLFNVLHVASQPELAPEAPQAEQAKWKATRRLISIMPDKYQDTLYEKHLKGSHLNSFALSEEVNLLRSALGGASIVRLDVMEERMRPRKYYARLSDGSLRVFSLHLTDSSARFVQLPEAEYVGNSSALVNFVLTSYGSRYKKSMGPLVADLVRSHPPVLVSIYHVGMDPIDREVYATLKDLNSTCNCIHLQHIQQDSFSKSVVLNRAIADTPANAIKMNIDLDITVPSDFAQSVRMYTVPGRQVFAPVVFSLYKNAKARKETNENGFWRHHGWGMIAAYKEDWLAVHGFDEARFGSQWGGEDSDMIERMLAHGLRCFRPRERGYFHNWHPAATKDCDQLPLKESRAACHALGYMTLGSPESIAADLWKCQDSLTKAQQ